MNDLPFDPSEEPGFAPELDHAVEIARGIEANVGRAVVGQRRAVREIVTSFLAAGHVLLEGVPGLGKTLTVLALARTFGGRFARVQFTPDLMPADVVGHAIYDAASGTFRIRRGPAFTHLLLADEINRAPAKTQSALLEVMQERQVTIEGEAYALEPPFMVLATQNPIELEGTYPLPEAQLDRFLLQIGVDYPEAGEEVALVEAVTAGRIGDALDVSSVEHVADAATVREVQRSLTRLTVDPTVIDYAVRLVRRSREYPGVAYGAGPRGAIAMVRAARAVALLEGRTFVLPDDVQAIAIPALRHRVVLAPELEIEGRRVDDVLASLLEAVEAPRGES